MNKMYNENFKKEFLSRYPETSQNTLQYLFYKSEPIERLLKKDLFEFSTDEIGTVIQNTDPLSLSTVKSTGSFISQYIGWGIEKGLTKSNINPLKNMTNEWYEQFIDKTKKLYFSEEEIKQLNKDLINAQDAVIIQLLFEGVNGQGSSEILNLTIKDVDFDTGELKLNDDKKGARTITVSEECLRLIRQAHNQREYHLKNGYSEARLTKVDLVENDFIIKHGKRKSKNMGRSDKHTVYRRISTISEIFDMPYLTPKGIQRSGMIKMAVDLYNRDGELEYKQFSEIAERFNLSKYNVNGFSQYNTSIMREYINEDNLFELYGIKINKN